MQGNEIIRELRGVRSEGHEFIRWWRKEEDFFDYDLIDRFVDNVSGSDIIGGFDLLTLPEMWSELTRTCGDRVMRFNKDNQEYIRWQPPGKGSGQTQECLYSAESMLKIFDVETKGNPVD